MDVLQIIENSDNGDRVMEVLQVLHLCNIPPQIIKTLVNRRLDKGGFMCMVVLW